MSNESVDNYILMFLLISVKANNYNYWLSLRSIKTSFMDGP